MLYLSHSAYCIVLTLHHGPWGNVACRDKYVCKFRFIVVSSTSLPEQVIGNVVVSGSSWACPTHLQQSQKWTAPDNRFGVDGKRGVPPLERGSKRVAFEETLTPKNLDERSSVAWQASPSCTSLRILEQVNTTRDRRKKAFQGHKKKTRKNFEIP